MKALSVCPDYDPLPHIPVVEMVSDDEEPEADSQFPPKSVSNTRCTNLGRHVHDPSVSPQCCQLD